jgi:hypothetical protein
MPISINRPPISAPFVHPHRRFRCPIASAKSPSIHDAHFRPFTTILSHLTVNRDIVLSRFVLKSQKQHKNDTLSYFQSEMPFVQPLAAIENTIAAATALV